MNIMKVTAARVTILLIYFQEPLNAGKRSDVQDLPTEEGEEEIIVYSETRLRYLLIFLLCLGSFGL
jgi:hypothetical protein